MQRNAVLVPVLHYFLFRLPTNRLTIIVISLSCVWAASLCSCVSSLLFVSRNSDFRRSHVSGVDVGAAYLFTLLHAPHVSGWSPLYSWLPAQWEHAVLLSLQFLPMCSYTWHLLQRESLKLVIYHNRCRFVPQLSCGLIYKVIPAISCFDYLHQLHPRTHIGFLNVAFRASLTKALPNAFAMTLLLLGVVENYEYWNAISTDSFVIFWWFSFLSCSILINLELVPSMPQLLFERQSTGQE